MFDNKKIRTLIINCDDKNIQSEEEALCEDALTREMRLESISER